MIRGVIASIVLVASGVAWSQVGPVPGSAIMPTFVSSSCPAGTTIVYLISGSTWIVPNCWNNANNKVETVASGGSGAASSTLGPTFATGGGGGSYSAQTNITLTKGASVTYQIGAAGTAVVDNSGTGTPGVPGNDTWFNGASFAMSSVGSRAGNGGVNGTSGGTGGAAASGIGATKTSGGRGGNRIAGGVFATGGGGAAGSSGNGGNGDDRTTPGATAGGQGDASSGGAGGIAPAADTLNGNSGGNGAEYGSSHGSGGGGSGSQSGATIGLFLTAGSAGTYGAGGGGAYARSGTATSGAGTQGLIVITYTN